MPFNGSGTFTLTYTWATEAGSPPIAISKLDTQEVDIASGLSNCITKDGQTTITANIPFNDKKITGLGAPTTTGDALSRGAAAVVTTLSITQGAIISGTYTPTLTSVENIDSSTAFVCQYMRVGSVVTVSGRATVNCTSGLGVDTRIGISLPIASNLAGATQCCGAGQHNAQNVGISGDSTNDRAQAYWVSGTASDAELYFTFTYLIV